MRKDMPGGTVASAPPPPSYSFPLLEVTTLCTETAEFKKTRKRKKEEHHNSTTPTAGSTSAASVQSPAHWQKLEQKPVWAELSNCALPCSSRHSSLHWVPKPCSYPLSLKPISSSSSLLQSIRNVLVKYNQILQEVRWLQSPASKEQISMGSGNSSLRNHAVQFCFLVRLPLCNHCACQEQPIQLEVASWTVGGTDKHTLIETLPRKTVAYYTKK